MNAYYDLGKKSPAFSFLEFCCAARTEGVDNVIIDNRNGYINGYERKEAKQRVHSIFPESCELFGMSHEFGGPHGECISPSHLPIGWIEAYKKHGRIAKVTSVLPPKSERFTVTIRKVKGHQDSRNSDEDAWRRFAKHIGAYVIEDYDTVPITLKERLAYYAGAEMNYFVVNGPMHLCIFSDYPYGIVMKNVKTEKMKTNGWPVGGQLWFANERQRCFWHDDSYENLLKVHETFF